MLFSPPVLKVAVYEIIGLEPALAEKSGQTIRPMVRPRKEQECAGREGVVRSSRGRAAQSLQSGVVMPHSSDAECAVLTPEHSI